MKIAAFLFPFAFSTLLTGQVYAANGLRSRTTKSTSQRDLSFDNPCWGNFSISDVEFKWVVTEYEDERPVDIEGSKITWGVPATKLGRSSFQATTSMPLDNIPANEPFQLADLEHINNILKKGSALKNVDLVMKIKTEQGNGTVVELEYAIRITETCNKCTTGENCSDDTIKITSYNNIGESDGIQYQFDLFFKENPEGPMIERFQTPEKKSSNLGLYGLFTVLGSCAPVAKCKNTTVYANGYCQAPKISINDGTYDIDSADFTVAEYFDGPSLSLGDNIIKLIASDGERESTCEATVTVLDVNYPGICCSISPVVSEDSPLTYIVEFSATDNCSGFSTTAKIVSADESDKCDDILVSFSGDIVTATVSDECEYKDGVELLVTATDNSGNSVECTSSAPGLLWRDTNGSTALPSTSTTSSPNKSPTLSPTFRPTTSRTSQPTRTPSVSPTTSPTDSPTISPTVTPTAGPSSAPTDNPTTLPTDSPTSSPTDSPTTLPTASPTSSPTDRPTTLPTASPTSAPSDSPTTSPTDSPIELPTLSPTASPTYNPTTLPSTTPTTSPTLSPSTSPMLSLTTSPTSNPTTSPTAAPTSSPTAAPATPSPTIAELITAKDECAPILHANFESGMSGWSMSNTGREGHNAALGAAFLQASASLSFDIPKSDLMESLTKETTIIKISYSFWSTHVEDGSNIFDDSNFFELQLNRQNVDENDTSYVAFHKEFIYHGYNSKESQFVNEVTLTLNPSQAKELQLRIMSNMSSNDEILYFEYIKIESCTEKPPPVFSCPMVNLNFDDLTPSTFVTRVGSGVSVTARGKGQSVTPRGAAMVFDTSNPICDDGKNNGDPDLGSPNILCSAPGPGEGPGGAPSAPYPNCEPQGNVLVIQERAFQDPSSPCPDDASDGGWIEFNFDTPVSFAMAKLLDVDDGNTPQITVWYDDEKGVSKTAITKVTWTGDNGVITEYPSHERVSKISIEYFGSGSIAEIGYYPCPVSGY